MTNHSILKLSNLLDHGLMRKLILLVILLTSTVAAQNMSDDQINKTMIATAKHYSKSLPMRIDQISTLRKIYAGLNRDLVYVYSVELDLSTLRKLNKVLHRDTLREGRSKEALVPLIEQHYRKLETINYCSQPGLLKIFRDQNITLEHRYIDQNSKYLFDLRLSVKDCNI